MNNIAEIERFLLTDPTVVSPDCTTKHIFSPGVYVREITMPENSIIVGAIHKTTHLNIISKGACVLVDLETNEMTDIIAPYTFESKAGVQKLLYIVEECVWSTVHVTDKTDIEVLESELIELSPTYKEVVGDKFIPGGKAHEFLDGRRSNSRRSYLGNR